MPAMQEITCRCGCGRKKNVRKADIARGWGKFYSKSCKARHQEKRTGQYRKHMEMVERCDNLDRTYLEIDDNDLGFHPFESGFFGHGQE